MDRDLARLRAAAKNVAADLRRVAAPGYQCEVDDNYVLTVIHGEESESVPLEREVGDEEWYLEPGRSLDEQTEALDAEAAEAVADEVLDVLRFMNWPSPRCDEHGVPLTSCSGIWVCDGPPTHDLPEIGKLGL